MGFGQFSELWDTGEGDDVRLGIEVPLVVAGEEDVESERTPGRVTGARI